jgi:DNA (cytosine-5)-methyltransferase 1
MAKHGVRAIRPLADNTLRRIAAGVQRYVIDAEKPFFVTYGQHGGANRDGDDPLHTLTASPKDQNAIVVPQLVSFYGPKPGKDDRAHMVDDPLPTVTTANRHGLIAAFLAQHNSAREGVNPGRAMDLPISTLTAVPNQQTVVAAHLINMKGTKRHAQSADEPVPTICASTTHAAIVSAFMVKYYGQGNGQGMDEPVHTVTVRDRFGLVTVSIDGQSYVIVDIGMRMLTEREKFRAQGFPDDYQIDVEVDGKMLTKADQGRCVGNSVCPDVARALIAANAGHLTVQREAAE